MGAFSPREARGEALGGERSEALVVVGRPVHFAGASTAEDDAYAEDRLRRALALAGLGIAGDVFDGQLVRHLRTKIELSEKPSTTFAFHDGPVAIEAKVARRDFERWIAPEVAAIAGCVDGLLAQTKVPASEVDRVFMTGGTALVPAVRKVFADRFGADRLRGGDELTSVASGLALRALELAGG